MNVSAQVAGVEQPDIMVGYARQRSAFAVQHLMAAARFSRQCGDIQRANTGKPLGSFYDEQIACVSATVMLAVASIESNINEHLADANDLFSELKIGARNEFCSLVSGLAILEKYDRVLAIKSSPPFERGKTPYQDIDILISIRNELVHFHPEWHDEQDRHKKLGQKLLYRFELSPFISEDTGAVVFPQRFVSHGCTKWAVESALAFMESFANRVGLPSRFQNHYDKLVEL